MFRNPHPSRTNKCSLQLYTKFNIDLSKHYIDVFKIVNIQDCAVSHIKYLKFKIQLYLGKSFL